MHNEIRGESSQDGWLHRSAMHTDTQRWKAGGVAVGVPAAKQVV